MTARKPLAAPFDNYIEALPLLRHVRVMDRVMEWVAEDPKTRASYYELFSAFMKILNGELAPNALTFALAITELEDAFPEIAALGAGVPGRSVQDESAHHDPRDESIVTPAQERYHRERRRQ